MKLYFTYVYVEAGLCNGSTTDSDSVCEGSNPSPAATGKSPGSAAFAALPGLFASDGASTAARLMGAQRRIFYELSKNVAKLNIIS